MKKNNDMTLMLAFAGGALFHLVLMPVLDSVGGLIQSAINAKISYMRMDLDDRECEHEAKHAVCQQPTNAIGFEYDE